MKLLAAVFAVIAFLSVLLGFAMNTMPILSLAGKVAALTAMVGLAVTAVAYVTEEVIPQLVFVMDDFHL